MKITILKYDPTVDDTPYDEEYDVPLVEHMTLLQALFYIDENYEPLAFDHSCRGRTCGRCAMMLDGVACTACTATLTDGSHTVKPLKGFPVIRDLVVDKKSALNNISALEKRVNAKEITWDEILKPVDMHAYEALNATERCARCLVCQASCPVLQGTAGSYLKPDDPSIGPDDYVGPAGMVSIALRYYDPYDEGDRVLQAVNAGMWNCVLCGTCDVVCPCLEIEHVNMWNEIRAEATARGLKEKIGSAFKFGVLK